jgi:hypothetical protein
VYVFARSRFAVTHRSFKWLEFEAEINQLWIMHVLAFCISSVEPLVSLSQEGQLGRQLLIYLIGELIIYVTV